MLNAFLALVIQAEAPAQGAPTQPPGGAAPASLMEMLSSMAVPLILCLVVFWVFMIGPERKQRKKRDEMLKALGKGDEVLTTSGIYGTIVVVQDGIATVQVADGVRMRFALHAITTVVSGKAETAKA